MGYSHVHTHKNEKMEKSKSKKVLKSLQWSAVNGNVSLLTTGKFVATQFRAPCSLWHARAGRRKERNE
jgi:hypothetical protein